MKKAFVIAAFLCCSIMSFGQTKGDISLYGNVSFNLSKNYYGGTQSSSSNFGIAAGASYFVIDNLSVGLGIGYSYSAYNRFQVAPSAAYYIGITDNFYYRPTLSYSIGFDKYDTTHNIDLAFGAFEYRFNNHFAATASLLDFNFMAQAKANYSSISLSLTFPSFGVIYYL